MGGSIREIGDYFFAGNTVYVINGSVIVHWQLSIVNFPDNFIVEDDTSHHDSVFTKYFGQFARIDACDARYFLTFQPVAKAFHCVPVAVLRRVVTYDDRFGMNLFTFHESGESVGFDGKRRNSVITHQRIGKSHQLSGVGRVSKALRISGHGGVENYFARHRLLVAKRLTGKPAPVVKD